MDKDIETGRRFVTVCRSCYGGFDVLLRMDGGVYLGTQGRAVPAKGSLPRGWNYDDSDKSLRLVSENPNMFCFMFGKAFAPSQKEMLSKGALSEKDYEEYEDLINGELKGYEKLRVKEVTFGGEPFRPSAKTADREYQNER